MSISDANALEDVLQAALAPHGLISFGWFRTEDGKCALLIGNAGRNLWPAFSRSAEYRAGGIDPLDRWTERVMTPIAAQFSAALRFPFKSKHGADTVWPFQRYAIAATGMRSSPIGLLIHPTFGLWIAFRAALVFDDHIAFCDAEKAAHPCDRCVNKPCLTTCPVSAFSNELFDVRACRDHVRSAAGTACATGGCLARRACPVGADHAYERQQQAFHMKAFA